MNRRTWLWSFVAALLAAPLRRLKAFARVQASTFAASDVATLEAIAEIVLPGDLGADGRKRVVGAFVTWIKDYKAGADRGYGYGASTLSAPAGPSPARPLSGAIGRARRGCAARKARPRLRRSRSDVAPRADRSVAQPAAGRSAIAGAAHRREPHRRSHGLLLQQRRSVEPRVPRARSTATAAGPLDGSDQPPAPLGSR